MADQKFYTDVCPEKNSEAICKIKDYVIKNNVNLYSFTVLHQDGRKETFAPRPCNPCNDSYSVTKAFTLTAIGILSDEGKLNVGDLVSKYFPIPETADGNWKSVTIENAIAHKMGLNCGCLDIDVEEFGSEDYLAILFSQPLPHKPGTFFTYSDGGYYLLSRIVTEVSGERLDDFLRTRLMNPLRVREAAWSQCPKGYPMGATGLYIRSEDTAKFAQLYLNGGVYQGKRIFSKEWADFVTSHNYEMGQIVPGVYGKGGMCGQFTMFSRNTGLSVGWHAYLTEGESDFYKFIANTIK